MNAGKFSLILIGFLVGVLVLASFLPVIGSVTATDKTFENEGIIKMDKIGTDTEVTIFWDHTDPTNITVNDSVIPIPNMSYVLTVTTGYDWVLRMQPNVITFFSPINVSASVTDSTDLIVTLSNGTVTVTNTASTPQTTTSSYEEVYLVSDSPDAKYVMKSPTSNAYLKGDSLIIGSGMSTVGGVGGYGYTGIGTIDDGITVSQFRGPTTTNTNPILTYSSVDGYIDLYEFDKYQFVADDTTLTWNQVIVPASVTVELSNPPSSLMISLFNLLPLIAGVGLLLGAVAYFLSRTYL